MDASALRWTLAIIGIVLLVGIYLFGVQQNRMRKRAARETFAREEIDSAFIEDEQLREELENLGPIVNDGADNLPLGSIKINPARGPDIVAEVDLFIGDDIAEIDPKNLISHLLKHADNRLITGEELHSSLALIGLEMNAEGLLEYHQADELYFSIGSLSAPGHFAEIESLEFNTLGLNCFIDIGNDSNSFKHYEIMLKKIDEMVRLLNVKVYQANQQLLTISEVTEIRRNLSA